MIQEVIAEFLAEIWGGGGGSSTMAVDVSRRRLVRLLAVCNAMLHGTRHGFLYVCKFNSSTFRISDCSFYSIILSPGSCKILHAFGIIRIQVCRTLNIWSHTMFAIMSNELLFFQLSFTAL